MATTSERRKIIKANKYMKSEAQMKAETQAYVKKQAEEQKKTKSDAGVAERYAETMWDVGGKVLSGAGKGVEGIFDLLIGGVGLVGGMFSEDFKEGAKRAVEYDVVGNLYGNAIEERTADSWLNDNKVGEVVEQTAEALGEMLPTVLVAIATGGTSAAASGASAAASAGSTAATAASAASKAAKVSKIASTATMATSAAGRGAEEALNDGAELEGAMAYGGLSGATEAVTENLMGGVFGKSLNVGKNAAKTGAKRVLKNMAEEAGEEVLAEAVSPLLKTTYKGADAFSEYADPEYYKGVLQAGLVGGLTSAAYGGTVGHAIHKARGTNADVDSVIDSMSDINKEKDKLFAKGKMSAAKYADMQSDVKTNMQSVERVLKKASPEQRQKLIEKYELEGLFDGDGNLDAEYVARLDKRIEAGRTGEFSPYVSPDLAADSERLASDIDTLNAGRADGEPEVNLFDGEFDSKGKEYYSDVRRAANNLNAISGRQFNIALVNGNVNFKGVIVNGNNIYINADRVQSGNAIGDLIHELTHFTEGSREYNALMRLLVSDTDSLRRKIVELTREGNAYGFTPETVENLSRMVSESRTDENAEQEYTDKEPQVQYSKNDTARDVIVIEADSELAKRIESSDKSKYEVIRDYLVDKFYGQTFNLSDGRQAIMDKRDAQELSHKADTRKTVELANLKKIVENAEYSHTAENVEHRKFTAFHYYVAKVMYKGAEFELWINVGVAKNDGKNHIYEIVNKKDEAPTNNGVSRPVGNAIPNASSENIIHQNSENVNNNSENISETNVSDGETATGLEGELLSEIVAGLAEDSIGMDGAFIDKLVRGNDTLAAKILNRIESMTAYLASRKTSEAREQYKRLKQAEKLFTDALAATGKTYRRGNVIGAVEEEEDEASRTQYSYIGKAEDGKGIYSSNFPKGTPKAAKSERILNYIKNVWSKKPIELVISNGETSRTIFAKFDPTVDESKQTPTDSSKLAGGNRHGTHAEQRVTLDLADDYYQIASESKYNYSKEETGKSAKTHEDVRMWHYFVNDIYFAEYGESELVPYTVTINVKEKDNGDFVYSFNAEKEPSTQRTLHAAVSTRKGANGELFLDDSIHQNSENVKSKLQYSRKTEGQTAKDNANIRRKKVYDKQDARAVISDIVAERLKTEDGYFGELIGKSRSEAINMLWIELNKAKKTDIEERAQKIAEYIIETSTLESMEMSPETEVALERISVLRDYLHTFDLTTLREEIQHSYGKDAKRIFSVWGKKEGGVSPDSIVDELSENGIVIYAENPADILFELDELYRSSKNAIRREEKIGLKEALSESEYSDMKRNIVEDILQAYYRNGKPSALKKISDRYKNKYRIIVNQKNVELQEAKENSGQKDRVNYIITQINEIEKGTYLSASGYQSHVFKEGFERIVKLHWRGKARADSKVREELKKIGDWYSSPKNMLFHDEDGNPNQFYDDDLSRGLSELSDTKRDKFSLQELKLLEEVVNEIKHSIDSYNKVWKNGRWRDAKQMSREQQAIAREAKKTQTGIIYKILSGKYFRAFADNASVYRAADGYNENGFFTTSFEGLREGIVSMAVMENELFTEYETFLKDKNNKGYVKHLTEGKIEYAGNLLTVGQIISLYMTTKRKRAWSAFVKSGFSVFDEKGNRIDFERIAVNPDDITSLEQMEQCAKQMRSELEGKLTDKDMEYIRIVEKVYEKCSVIKEKTDMIKWGRSNIIHDYYYPIRRYDIATTVENTSFYAEMQTTSNMTFNYDTVDSSNKLLIESVDTVLKRHTNGVLLYSNFAIWVDNFNRIMNVDTGSNHWTHETLRGEIEKTVYHKNVLSHLMKLEKDIVSGKILNDPDYEKFMVKMRRAYANFQLGANLKVFPTQFSAVFAAGSVLEYNCIARGLSVKGIFKEVDRYCPLAKVRNSDNTAVKAQTVTDKVGKVGDAMLTPIDWGDRINIGWLFGACQLQIARDGGAKLGTVENKKAAGKLLEKVILETQQNSLLTERSSAMRSDYELPKSFTMFTADAMKTTGRVLDGMGEVSVIKRKLKLFDPDKNAAEIARLENERAELKSEIIKEKEWLFENAEVNDDIINLVDKVESGEYKDNDKAYFGTITKNTATTIHDITGIDVSDFRVAIEARQINHILHDHGINGVTDNSMKDKSMIAKLEYVLNNPDNIMLAGKTQAYSYMKHGKNRTADTVLYEKEIGEKSYYVVQAVADTKAKTLYIVSAFVGKKGYKKGTSQLINDNVPDATVDTGSVVVPTDSIPENSQNVNSISENNRSEFEERLAYIDERLDYLRNEKKYLERNLKKAEKKLRRSVSALVSSSIYMALLSLFFKALYAKLRDKEPEEVAVDTVFDFFGNMLGGLPIYSDIYSFITDGYEVDIFALDMFNQLLYACTSSITLAENALSGKDVTRQDVASTVKKVVVSTGMLFGIPVRNAYNLTSGLLNTFLPQTGYALNDFFGETSRSADLKRAIENEDEKMIGVITSLMTGEGDTEYTATTEKALNGLLSEGYSVLPRSVGDTVTYNGVTVELDRSQKKKIKSIYSEADKAVNSLTSLSEFQKASSDIQAKAIRFINNLYYQMALGETLGDGEKSKYELFAAGIDVYRLAIIIAVAQSIEADKDAKGNAISGSKKKKVMEFIEAQRLTAAQKHMIAGALGYTNTKGEQKVMSYISTLSLTEQEKSRLLEYSGYKVA